MNENWTPEDVKRQLINRSRRLAKLIELSAPDAIINNEFGVIVRQMFLLYGAAAGTAAATALVPFLRNAYSMCSRCLSPLTDAKSTLCPKCKLAEAMEQAQFEMDNPELFDEEG